MFRSAKAALARLARRLGYEIIPVSFAPTMDAALGRLSRRVPVRTIVDVGASDGRWSRVAMRHFPRADYLLIEAQGAAHGAALRELADRDHRVHVVLAAAGDRVGEVRFDASDPFGGIAMKEPSGSGAEAITVPMTTLDAEVARCGLEPPYLIKLDTHGFEVPILQGARDILLRTNALVIEAYNFTLRDGTLRFHELCHHLSELGYRSADLADPMWRPGDGILWQLDLFFVPNTRPEFAHNAYR